VRDTDRATSGTLDGAHFGGYGVARAGPWYAAGTLAFSVFDNRTSRTIAGVGLTEIANGSFRSDLLNGRFELGVKQAFDAIAVSPFAAVQFAELWQRGDSETSIAATGAPGVLGLTYASRAVSSLPTFLGVQLDARLTLANGMTWTPYARASWVHEFEPTRGRAGLHRAAGQRVRRRRSARRQGCGAGRSRLEARDHPQYLLVR
jgi:outer membrane autotransporter protein